MLIHCSGLVQAVMKTGDAMPEDLAKLIREGQIKTGQELQKAMVDSKEGPLANLLKKSDPVLAPLEVSQQTLIGPQGSLKVSRTFPDWPQRMSERFLKAHRTLSDWARRFYDWPLHFVRMFPSCSPTRSPIGPESPNRSPNL
jgi:hypothetical protein